MLAEDKPESKQRRPPRAVAFLFSGDRTVIMRLLKLSGRKEFPLLKKPILFLLAMVFLLPFSPAQQSGSVNESQAILSFLNQSIVWYRQLTSEQQLATEPSDVLYLNDNKQLADDIVRQSFDFARARAQMLSDQNENAAPASTQSGSPNRLSAIAARAEQQVKSLQGDVDSIRRQLDSATGKNRKLLDAQLAETESELQLAQARRDTLRTMVAFSASAGGADAGSLQSQVDELARAVPSAAAVDSKAASGTAPATQPAKVQVSTAPTRSSTPTGILALVSDLLALHRKTDSLQTAMTMSDQLAAASKELRTPLTAQVKQLAAQSEKLAAEPATGDVKELADQKKRVDGLTTQFKQISAAILPLSKQRILLDVYKRSLDNWRNSIQSQYRSELKSLILRLVILGILIGMIAAMSELWKRATFRYVHDVRRRYQFLLLRRIVVWIVVAIVVAAAFATELGTLATFAGLLTAGIAVALQNVILSVAGYFFLIGRYGIRVGDRVQVAGVTGDVIDIGLVRLHIMEVGSSDADARATGRVVVFSNSVVFQPNSGLFKQIPGTSFVWHDISLTLAAHSNYQLVEQRMMEAVNSVYAKYKEKMEGQRRRMEQSLTGINVRSLDPESRLRLTQTGLEVVIRYPVDLANAAQIDDEMARALLDAIGKEPRLRLVGSGTPNITEANEPARIG
jgi:small-conductance mechanosensitive channel